MLSISAVSINAALLKMGCLLNTPGVGFDSVANAIDQCQYQCWWCLIERPCRPLEGMGCWVHC